MELKPYHLHPAAVHFPIALLAAGAAAAAARLSRKAPAWLSQAESWLLWLGTGSVWVALYLGTVAESSAPHKPLAWEVLSDHETLAWWTGAAFTALSSLRFFAVRTGRDRDRWRVGQLALWLIAYATLIAAAAHGAKLVYLFGMGVDAP